ncbi:MAG: hypothetical protein KC731_36170 [Myxococcales bacterium]|nr:hypothetical protein [Myxococcales bacterium]
MKLLSSAVSGSPLVGPVLGLWLVVMGLGGCDSGNQKDPNAPSAGTERRDTEMEHEDCDISSGKGLDANGDGRPDIVQVFSGGKETCRAVDINMDTVIDRFIYFDAAGNKRRVESGFDRDARPDEIAYYENGQLVRKERGTTNDQRIDTWSYYEGGQLVREERDSTGDGYIDQWWQFNDPTKLECAVVVTDGDGDGKPDPGSEIDTCERDKKPDPGAETPVPQPDEGAGGGAAESGEGSGESAPPAEGEPDTPPAESGEETP